MKIIIAALLLASAVALAQGGVTVNKLAEPLSESRVNGGIVASDGQFPFHAFIIIHAFNGNTFYCSGALIGKSWVLTTAHCLMRPTSVQVHLGAADSRNSPVVLRSGIYTRHSGYSQSLGDNDIGLIALPKVVTETKYIQVIQFAKSSDVVNDDEIAVVVGTSDRGMAIQNYGTARIISNAECNAYNEYIPESRLCTFGYPDPKQLPCEDHGSPLVVYRNNKTVLIGLVNKSLGCKYSHLPVGYTRVSSFTNWIAQNSGLTQE